MAFSRSAGAALGGAPLRAMTGMPRSAGPAAVPGAVPRRRERLGFIFVLSLIWLLFEIGRPPTPPGLPLLITGALFFDWIGKRDKQWASYSFWWFVMLGVVAIGVMIAPNTFAAYFNTRLFATLFLGMCLPLQALVNSVTRTRAWIYALIGVSFYVGAWAVTHNGFGPAASDGQDENYVATLMGMGVALAYFSMFAEKRKLVKVLLAVTMCVCVAAMAVASNPSRGGFLALCTVALYCLWRSPRKLLGISILGGVAAALFLVAGDTFWNEIDTTTDYQDGTGDMRIEIWKAGVRMWQANPVLGVGSGNFRWVIGDYQDERQFQKFGRSLGGSIIAHSMHVELIAELGTAGAICFWMLVLNTWIGLGRIRVQKPPPGHPPLDPALVQLSCYADAIRAAMLAVLVSGVFLSLLYYSHIWVLLAVGSALPFVHRRILQQAASQAPAPSIAAAPVAPRPTARPVVPMLPPPRPGAGRHA